MRKRLRKCIASFDYFEKLLLVLSVKTGSISITSFATVIGALVGIGNASFSLEFPHFTGIVKRLFKTTRNTNKKHSRFIMLARIKLNSI